MLYEVITVFGAIDTVGVACESPDALCAIESNPQRQEELGIASAAPGTAHGHGRLAARKENAWRSHGLAVTQHLARDAGMHQCDFPCFTLDGIAEDQGRDAKSAGNVGGRLQ